MSSGSTAGGGVSGACDCPRLCPPLRPPRPSSVLPAPPPGPGAGPRPSGKSVREGRGRRSGFLPSSLLPFSVSFSTSHCLPAQAWLPRAFFGGGGGEGLLNGEGGGAGPCCGLVEVSWRGYPPPPPLYSFLTPPPWFEIGTLIGRFLLTSYLLGCQAGKMGGGRMSAAWEKRGMRQRGLRASPPRSLLTC